MTVDWREFGWTVVKNRFVWHKRRWRVINCPKLHKRAKTKPSWIEWSPGDQIDSWRAQNSQRGGHEEARSWLPRRVLRPHAHRAFQCAEIGQSEGAVSCGRRLFRGRNCKSKRTQCVDIRRTDTNCEGSKMGQRGPYWHTLRCRRVSPRQVQLLVLHSWRWPRIHRRRRRYVPTT